MIIFEKEYGVCCFTRVELKLPTVKVIKDANEWISNPSDPIKGIDISFNTNIIIRRSKEYRYIAITLFGFGFVFLKQTGY